jgi:solute carrier family 25 citrate transporter 1
VITIKKNFGVDSFFDMPRDERRDGEEVVKKNNATTTTTTVSSLLSPFFDQFVAGAASGLASRLVTHPMDTIKSRMQVHAATRRTGHRGALLRSGFGRNITTTNNNAFFGYYKGFGAVALGSPLASGMYFLGYETTKKTLAKVRGDDGGETTAAAAAAMDNVLTGIVAQALAGIAYTPVDVIKERMQVSSVLPKHLKTNNGIDYRNVFDAVKTIAQNEGVKNGLMRGYWAQNFVWWPWSASYFVVYEKGLEIFSRSNNNNNNNNNDDDDDDSVQTMYNVSPHAASAFTAATFATVLTHPLDLCKTRIQTMTAKGMNGGGGGSLTLKMACVDVVKTEGVLALYRGVWARILSVAPGSAISFYAYESIRKSGMLRLDDYDRDDYDDP